MSNVYSRVKLLPGTEVVAAMIGTLITNDRNEIREKIQTGEEVVLLTRQEMRLMAAAELGEKWVTLANGPTLIKV